MPEPSNARGPIPTWCFAFVVVRRGDRFLLVEERKHGGGWYLPAGRVELGETFAEAAVRETQEEAGLAIVIDGILRVEHTPMPGGSARLRVIFAASPADPDAEPRTTPNEHTLGARFMTLEETRGVRMRGADARAMIEAVAAGAAVAPASVLTHERAAWM